MARFLLFLTIIAVVSSCNTQNELPGQIKYITSRDYPWHRSITTTKYYHIPSKQELYLKDINQDGQQEYFVVSNKFRRKNNVIMRIFDNNLEYFNVAFPDHILTPLGFQDINGDKQQEIIALTISSDSELKLWVLNAEGKLLQNFSIGKLDDEQHANSELELLQFYFINTKKAAMPDLIVAFNYHSGYVFRISLTEQKVLWQLNINHIEQLTFHAQDESNPRELFLLSNPQLRLDEMQSRIGNVAWLYRINRNGQQVHAPLQLEGKTSRGTFFSDSQKLWLFYSPNQLNGISKIYSYDYEHQNLKTIEESKEMFLGRAVKWSIPEIPQLYAIIASKNSKLLLLDRYGKIFHSLQDPKFYQFSAVRTVSLHNDSRTQLIIDSKQRGMNILNHNFFCELNFRTSHYLEKVWAKNVQFLMYSHNENQFGKVYQINLDPIILSNRFYYTWGGIGFLFLLVLAASPAIRRRIIAQKNLLTNALDKNSNPSLIISGKGKIIRTNFAFKKEFKDLAVLPPNSNLNSFLIKPKYRMLRSTLAGAILENNNQDYRLNLPVDGKIREFQLNVTPLSKGKKTFRMLIEFRNLSNSLKTEQEQLWTNVARDVAHKVKTPLSTIMLAFNNINKLYGKDDDPKQDKLKLIISNASLEIERIREQSRALMLLARVSESKLSDVKPDLVIAQIFDNWNHIAIHDITIKYDYPKTIPLIQANEQDLRNIFENLISNSIAAMPGGGTLMISIHEKYDFNDIGLENNRVEIEVSDNGCGIPKDKLEAIFEAYYTTKKEGTGLGMVIVKRLVEIQGGEIKVHSREGIGTTVTLTFIKSTPKLAESKNGPNTDH